MKQNVKKRSKQKTTSQKKVLDWYNKIEHAKINYTCECRRCNNIKTRWSDVGRTCADDINADADDCKFQINGLDRPYYEYTNWDKCYEYSTDVEYKYVPWLPAWWEKN